MIPQPKYNIGQTVYHAHANWSAKRMPCPDCLGSAQWSVTTPAGETFQVACNTCNEGWHSSGLINDYNYYPSVTAITIGSVRIDTNDENPISYMCVETGVGSGSIHDERYLFATRDEAMVCALKESTESMERRKAEQEKKLKQSKRKNIYKPKKGAQP